uniref:universal stress protein n=1 Tax=Paractinoplanes polyasparticus TaxID=2856853 RepID=UPI001C851660|nr:universal stress protein [Actinoplanes polyasparticus]
MPDVQPQTRRTAGLHGPATVVVGVDGTDGAITAVRWAATHARATGARLQLIEAVKESVSATITLPAPVSFTGVAPRSRARPGGRALALATAEARLFAPNVEISGRIELGGGADVLVAASAGADLLVVGSRGPGRLSGSLAGSVGMRVATQAHCPTAVICGDGDANGPVVVAVDGSQTSIPALRFAFAEAARRRAGLIAVHAWTPPVIPIGAGQSIVHPMATDPVRTELRRAAGRLVTSVMAPWRSAFPHVDVVELVLENSAEVGLPHSTAGAVLAVVGSRGRGRLSSLLFGSTSQAMLSGADCPVVVVREARASNDS